MLCGTKSLDWLAKLIDIWVVFRKIILSFSIQKSLCLTSFLSRCCSLSCSLPLLMGRQLHCTEVMLGGATL